MSPMLPRSEHPSIDEQVRQRAARITPYVTVILLIAVPVMIGGICWRWATVHEPTSAVVIGGDASLEGASIMVTSGNRSWTVGLDRANNWQTPVLLDPGEYHITATHRGHVLLNESFEVERFKGMRFDLPSMVQIVGAGLLGEAKVEIIHLSGEAPEMAQEIKLPAADRYRAIIYRNPGLYRAVARTPERVLAQVEFTVDRSQPPVRVDLARAAVEGE